MERKAVDFNADFCREVEEGAGWGWGRRSQDNRVGVRGRRQKGIFAGGRDGGGTEAFKSATSHGGGGDGLLYKWWRWCERLGRRSGFFIVVGSVRGRACGGGGSRRSQVSHLRG